MDLETSVDKAVEKGMAEAVDKSAAIPFGDESLYTKLEPFLRDFGDIVHSDIEDDNRDLMAAMSNALFYRDNLACKPEDEDVFAYWYGKYIGEVGRLLVRAAYNNGFRAKHFRETDNG